MGRIRQAMSGFLFLMIMLLPWGLLAQTPIPSISDHPSNTQLLFAADFFDDVPGEIPVGWRVVNSSGFAEAIPDVNSSSGKVLRLVSDRGPEESAFQISGPRWNPQYADATAVSVEYKVKVIQGSLFNVYVTGPTGYHTQLHIPSSRQLRARDGNEFVNIPDAIVEDGWNHVKFTVNRESGEWYVYLNDMDLPVAGPFRLMRPIETWDNLYLHFLLGSSQSEILHGDIKVYVNHNEPGQPIEDDENGHDQDGGDDKGHADVQRLRATRGEIVPEMISPNLLPNGNFNSGLAGWSLINETGGPVKMDVVETNNGTVLKLEKTGEGVVRLVSDRIEVTPGYQYRATALYQTSNATFGSAAEISLAEITNSAQAESRDVPAWRPATGAHVANRSIFNSSPEDWRRVTRTFTVSPGTTDVRLVYTLEGPPIIVMLDDIYFSEPREVPRLSASPPPEQPARLADRMAALVEGRRKLNSRVDSSAAVHTVSGVPRLFIDGEPSVPQVHMGDVWNPANGYFKHFAEYGVNVHIVQLRNIWEGYKNYDFDQIDSILSDAILRDPEGYFIVKLDLTPYRTWHEEFPEHVAQDRDGNYATMRNGRYAPPDYWSDEYRDQVYHLIETFVEHIHRQSYSKAVIGYFLSGGNDDQFFWNTESLTRTVHDGVAPGSLPLFQRWIQQKYETEDQLRKAWGDESLTFDNVRPPVKNERYLGTFMDPQVNQKEIDFITYLNEEMAVMLLEGARIAKETAPKNIVVGAYYGRGASMSVYPKFAQTQVMLQSDWIDFIGAQPGYSTWRAVGSEGLVSWVFDSARSHGKVMMAEIDYRTWKGRMESLQRDYQLSRFWNIDDLQNATARDLGKMLSIMGGGWWMEMTGGWFHDETIMDLIGRLREASQEIYETDPTISPAEIVFVSDEESYFWTTDQINLMQGVHTHSLALQQKAINRAGVKYDFYYLNDIIEQEMDQYKVYVFLNLYHVDQEKRAFIENRLKRDGKVLLWQYAPGFVTPQRLSIESMTCLTGIQLGTDHGALSAQFRDEISAGSNWADALLQGLKGSRVGVGQDPSVQRFYVDDQTANPLAYYNDGRVAAAVKEADNYTSIYMGHPSGLTPQFIANMAGTAGVHVFMEPGEMFMHHRDDFIVIHGVEGKDRTLHLPYEATVTDLLGDRVFPERVKDVELSIEPGETIWLKVDK